MRRRAYNPAVNYSSAKAPSPFGARQFSVFSARLKTETELAMRWAADGAFAASTPPKIGCEVECCLVGESFLPAPKGEDLVANFPGDGATYELGKFNAEFNLPPLPLRGAAFSRLEKSMRGHLREASKVAAKFQSKIYLGGILPTLTPADFVSEMISDRPRYAMLERQLRRMNKNRPFAVNLGYGDGLQFAVNSAAIEAAATSYQTHLEIAEPDSARLYNAAQVAAAPVLAAGANAPFFMGRKLWAETRVPLFEQILFARFAGKNDSHRRRREDIFGRRYLRGSLAGLFADNLAHFPPLLPLTKKTPARAMHHLAFHNGTIWRWNRPVFGRNENGAPQLRIEFRPLPSGPTFADMTANTAFFAGLVYGFCGMRASGAIPELPFFAARENFYAAARDGLDSKLVWTDGKKHSARSLILRKLIPAARRGLESLSELSQSDGEKYLSIVAARAEKNQNGAQWQTRFADKHNRGAAGMSRLAAAYWRNQQTGAPVHEWGV